MLLKIPVKLLKALATKYPDSLIFTVEREESWHSRPEEHDSGMFTHAQLDGMLAEAEANHKADKEGRALIRVLKQIAKAREPGRKFGPSMLPALAEALRLHYAALPGHRFYVESGGYMLPYLVTAIDYHPAERSKDWYRPAYVTLSGNAIERGDVVSISRSITADTIGAGKTVIDTLNRWGLHDETEELNEEYRGIIESYRARRVRLGHMFIARGTGYLESESRWQTRGKAEFDTGSRVVVDDEGYKNGNQLVPSRLFSTPIEINQEELVDLDEAEEDAEGADEDDNPRRRKPRSGYSKPDDTEEDEGPPPPVYVLPAHPFIRVFDLKDHAFYTTHSENLQPYRYNKLLKQKLIIPAGRKRVIDLLVKATGGGKDIVGGGKGEGVILLLSGPPGTGKTLTAEVYSEYAERPLYTVQCSQLGTTPVNLETELSTVLARATRWGAILLIDEADVYIRARGDDINQNAIVGVFLRLLEYYRGTLFMNTNREALVDDAIVSRLTAHLRYDYPPFEDRVTLWAQYLELYKGAVDNNTLRALAEEYKQISGRSIRNACRLARALADEQGGKVTAKLIGEVMEYIDSGEVQSRE